MREAYGINLPRGESTEKVRVLGATEKRYALWNTVAFGLVAALLALLAIGAPGAQASEAKVTVGPAEVSKALFVAGDVARLSKVPSGTEDVILEKALQQLYADEPTIAPATAEADVEAMKASLGASTAPSSASLQLMAGNQRIVAILATLERPYGNPATELPSAAKLAVTHLAAVALSGSSNIFASSEEPKYFEPLADARTNLAYTTFAPATVLRDTRELAATNHAFGEARDALWKTASEESVFSEWRELLSESKQVLGSEALEELRGLIEAGKGTLTEEPSQLTVLFTQGQKTTQEQSCAHAGTGEEAIGAESIHGVPRLKCSGGALYEDSHARRSGCSASEKTGCQTELAELQSHAAKQARVIAEEHAAMIAAAELLRPSDNTAASLQQATAQAQAQISEEETAYANYEAEKAQKEAIADGIKEGLMAGSAVLAIGTENYSEGISGLIGVGFELYEHTEEGLSHPPPGPQEITLQDLADLSTQLSGFQQYTQEAFHALNIQVAQLSAQLARENYELKEELGSLGERLVKEQGTIFALQDQVKELFAAQTKADLQTTIDDSVGWLKRTGEPLSGPRTQEALVALSKDATEIANSALVNSSETQPYTFEGADRQLTSKKTGEPSELSEDISYLGRFPSEQGWVSNGAPASLANTAFWAESSRAYAQLLLENTSHVTSADTADLKALEREGTTLEKTQAVWSEGSGEPGSKTGNAVLDRALSSFEAAAEGAGVDGAGSIQALLKEAAEKSLERSLKVVKTSSALANPTNLSLWGGAEQSPNVQAIVDAKYPALKWQECSGSKGKNGAQEMPQTFVEGLPAALLNGVRLGVVGAPGSGDPLILEACRTITEASAEVTGTESATGREYCTSADSSICVYVYQFEAKSERNAETVSETLTLTDGSSKLDLISPNTCEQTAQYWTGEGESYSEDEQTGVVNAGSREKIKDTFVGRHGGTVSKLSAHEDEVKWSPDSKAVFAGSVCPYDGAEEGAEEKTGIEYATYGGSQNVLGSAASTVLGKVDEKLRALQEEAYEEGLHELANPPVGNPLESLAGAKALVQSYVKLGFPQALASDAALENDIEGLGAQFLDPEPGSPRPLPEQLTALIDSWIRRLEKAGGTGQPEVKQLLTDDLIGEVATRASGWAKEVAEQLKPYVEGKVEGFDTGKGEAVGEQSSLVESTLNRLQLTRDVLSEAKAPTAETLAPSDVKTAEATVRGEVDANDGVVESCAFEYGATEFYGHSVECSTIPSAGEKAIVVSGKIANWTPEGSFHERVVLKTWGGTSYGEDVKVQLAQSTQAPSGGLVIASAGTPGATIGGFKAEELPAGIELPQGVKQIVGSLKFTVNVTPGGTARVKIELPAGSAPTALYKPVHTSGGEQYQEVPSSLYTISGATIELTLVDGGPEDEDGEVNGVIVDPLVPVSGTKVPTTPTTTSTQSSSTTSSSTSASSTTTTTSSTASAPAPGTGATHSSHSTPLECVSHRQVTVDVADHVSLPAGAKVLRTEILLHGRAVARLNGRAQAAVVSFAGLAKGPYEVTLRAKLSNGETLEHKLVFHTCAAAAKPKAPAK